MDSVFINGDVITMDPRRPRAEALAVRGAKILTVGSNGDTMSAVSVDTQVRDLKGLCIVPGMVDSHLHLVGYGMSLRSIDLRGVRSIDEIKGAVRERLQSSTPGELIRGMGWDQERLVERRYPNKWDLDEASPDNPVVLSRVCGHVICLSSKALELAGIDRNTPNPPGGEIQREQGSGEPTGILKEAGDLVWEKLPRPSEEDYLLCADSACRELAMKGLTTVHFMSATWPEVKALHQLREEGRLPIRVRLYANVEDLEKIEEGLVNDDVLKLCGVKVFMDGSLGGRTALLSEPYSDDSSTTGISVIIEERARSTFEQVHRAGLQLAVHSIGDEATRRALDMLDAILKTYPPSDHRHRIEHASVLTPELMDKIKELNLVASVQPHFVISDFWAVSRVGSGRAGGVYAFKSLRQKGIVTPAGSDCPVEPPSPLLGIEAAVARGEREGIELGNLTPGEKLSPDEALQMYTEWGGYATHEEGKIGVLREGSFADFVGLSMDPLSCAPDELRSILVRLTVVGGRVVHES